jgi:hypothetical protein
MSLAPWMMRPAFEAFSRERFSPEASKVATLSVPRFYEQTVHGFLRYLDSRIENKEAILRACPEMHRPLVKTEIAELAVVRSQLEAMLGVAPKTPRFTYTVMADCGVGEFLWIHRCTDPKGYVANAASLMDQGTGHKAMSRELFDDFCTWANRYMEWEREKHQREMDWESFNAEGRRLAVRLKGEVGALVGVEYCRAYLDPRAARGDSK